MRSKRCLNARVGQDLTKKFTTRQTAIKEAQAKYELPGRRERRAERRATKAGRGAGDRVFAVWCFLFVSLSLLSAGSSARQKVSEDRLRRAVHNQKAHTRRAPSLVSHVLAG